MIILTYIQLYGTGIPVPYVLFKFDFLAMQENLPAFCTLHSAFVCEANTI